MDFGKLKDIAKTATEKTIAGVSKANETRKKASQENKMAGGSRKKKGTIDSTSVTTTEEKPGKAVVKFRAVNGDEVKTIKTKLTQAEANNVQMFFLS